MIFSTFNIPKYKHIPRNIQSSFIKDNGDKKYSTKNNFGLKHSSSLKSLKKFHKHSKSKVDSNSLDSEKSNNATVIVLLIKKRKIKIFLCKQVFLFYLIIKKYLNQLSQK